MYLFPVMEKLIQVSVIDVLLVEFLRLYTDMLTFSCFLLYMHAKIALIPVMDFLFLFLKFLDFPVSNNDHF